MKLDRDFRSSLFSLLSVVLGNALYALVVQLFLLPAELVVGGTTGLALVAGNYLHIPISAFVFAFNVVMLIVGALVLGKAFALTTLASSFLYPLFLELFRHLFGDAQLTADPMLSTVLAGLGVGVGLGLVIRSGASTGGMDIPPLILQKKLRIPVSVGLYAFDFLILLLQISFRSTEKVLYGFLLVVIYTVVLDKMLLMGQSRTELKIISSRTDEIRDAVLNQVDRGVTILKAEGGYLRQETQVILTVVSNRELAKMEKIIRAIDPESFVVVNRVTEVRGKGFSIKRN